MPIYACSTISGTEKADDLAEVAFCARKSKGGYEPHGEFDALTSRPLDDPTFTLIGHSARGWNPFKSKPEKIGKLSPKDIAKKLAKAYGKNKDKLTTLNLISCEAGVEFNGTTLAQQVADELGKAGFSNVKVIAPSPPPISKQQRQLVTLTSSGVKDKDGKFKTTRMRVEARVFASSKECERYLSDTQGLTVKELEAKEKAGKLSGKVTVKGATPSAFLMSLKYIDDNAVYTPSTSAKAARTPMTLEIDHTHGVEPPSESTSTISDRALVQLKTELKTTIPDTKPSAGFFSRKPASLHQQIDKAGNLGDIKSILAKEAPEAQGIVQRVEHRQRLLDKVTTLENFMKNDALFEPEGSNQPKARRDLELMKVRIMNTTDTATLDTLTSEINAAERMLKSPGIEKLSASYAELKDINKQIESRKHPSVKPNSTNHLRLKKKMRNIKAEVSNQPIKTLNQALTTQTMEKYLKKNWNRGNDPFSYIYSKTYNHRCFKTLKSDIQNAKDEARREAETDKPPARGNSKN